MVKLNKIYTRTGDGGDTGLGDGSRVPKHAMRVTAYGEVDEANAVIGLALAAIGGSDDLPFQAVLLRIQNDLFDLGADLCLPPQDGEDAGTALRVTPDQVTALEAEIDRLNADLEPLTSFVLPGGTAFSAHLHHARTVVRRAERAVTALSQAEPIGAPVLQYLNRLSDLLFVMARMANKAQGGDVLWRPGGDR